MGRLGAQQVLEVSAGLVELMADSRDLDVDLPASPPLEPKFLYKCWVRWLVEYCLLVGDTEPVDSPFGRLQEVYLHNQRAEREAEALASLERLAAQGASA